MAAAAPIDHLVHHATMITLKGKSYRLRERGQGTFAGHTLPKAKGRGMSSSVTPSSSM